MRLSSAEGVSKLEILRFSGVTLPLPKGYEANTERSDESSFTRTGRGARFDTVWARKGHSQSVGERRLTESDKDQYRTKVQLPSTDVTTNI